MKLHGKVQLLWAQPLYLHLKLVFMKQLKVIIQLTGIKQCPDAYKLGVSMSSASIYFNSTMQSALLKMIKNAAD
jgi:hypothetical protein